MEKSSMERDLDDWEFLSDDGFLDLGGHYHESGKSALFARAASPGFGPKGPVDVNYFVCPPSPPHLLIGAAEGLIPAGGFRHRAPPGWSDPAAEKDPDEGFIREIREITPVMLANQEVISQVFFRKLGESEFADMKLDSPPKSPTARSLKQQPLVEVAGPVGYEEKGGGEEEGLGKGVEQGHGGDPKMGPPRVEEEGKEARREEISQQKACWESFGFSVWRRRITGVGALCSVGVAAATICIFILSGRQRQKHHQQNQKLQFQIYHDEKVHQNS